MEVGHDQMLHIYAHTYIHNYILIVLPLHNHVWKALLEPCHLHLVLSTCPTIMLVISILINRALPQLDMLITLGEGDKEQELILTCTIHTYVSMYILCAYVAAVYGKTAESLQWSKKA